MDQTEAISLNVLNSCDSSRGQIVQLYQSNVPLETCQHQSHLMLEDMRAASTQLVLGIESGKRHLWLAMRGIRNPSGAECSLEDGRNQ